MTQFYSSNVCWQSGLCQRFMFQCFSFNGNMGNENSLLVRVYPVLLQGAWGGVAVRLSAHITASTGSLIRTGCRFLSVKCKWKVIKGWRATSVCLQF